MRSGLVGRADELADSAVHDGSDQVGDFHALLSGHQKVHGHNDG